MSALLDRDIYLSGQLDVSLFEMRPAVQWNLIQSVNGAYVMDFIVKIFY